MLVSVDVGEDSLTELRGGRSMSSSNTAVKIIATTGISKHATERYRIPIPLEVWSLTEGTGS